MYKSVQCLKERPIVPVLFWYFKYVCAYVCMGICKCGCIYVYL